jgi:hypothetical protein
LKLEKSHKALQWEHFNFELFYSVTYYFFLIKFDKKSQLYETPSLVPSRVVSISKRHIGMWEAYNNCP